MTSVQDAIKQAQEAAGAVAGTDVIEASVDQGGNVTTYSKPSMTQMMAATGLIPRSTPYLKVNEFGLMIGKNREFLESFKAKILMVEDRGFQGKFTVRFGNPANYLSTYDGAACDKGGSWGDAMVRARNADPKAEPYPSVDILITLDEDVTLKKAKETFEAGSQVALNTSKTNWSEWEDFYKEVVDAGKVGEEVDVEIGYRAIEHNQNTWGVVTFKLL